MDSIKLGFSEFPFQRVRAKSIWEKEKYGTFNMENMEKYWKIMLKKLMKINELIVLSRVVSWSRTYANPEKERMFNVWMRKRCFANSDVSEIAKSQPVWSRMLLYSTCIHARREGWVGGTPAAREVNQFVSTGDSFEKQNQLKKAARLLQRV